MESQPQNPDFRINPEYFTHDVMTRRVIKGPGNKLGGY